MTSRRREADYDAFARIYELHWSREVPTQLLGAMDALLVSQIPRGARLLDLCCGTGYVAGELAKRGFDVTGLDNSKAMLAHARRNAPDARFIHADARTFDLPSRFDAIISIFDSLNHLLSLEELDSVFRNVRRALAPGGVFFFDMNMERGFLAHWADHYSIVEDEDVCILRGDYDRKARVGRYEITVFRREAKHWRRTDTVIRERCYTAREIKGALRRAGFRAVSSFDAETELELTEHVGRVFFLAHADA